MLSYLSVFHRVHVPHDDSNEQACPNVRWNEGINSTQSVVSRNREENAKQGKENKIKAAGAEQVYRVSAAR